MVLLDAHYTLGDESVKVTLPVSNAIATDLHVRDSSSLATPLRERFNRKPRLRCDILGTQKRMSRHVRWRTFSSISLSALRKIDSRFRVPQHTVAREHPKSVLNFRNIA
jgi:hypothetical protein